MRGRQRLHVFLAVVSVAVCRQLFGNLFPLAVNHFVVAQQPTIAAPFNSPALHKVFSLPKTHLRCGQECGQWYAGTLLKTRINIVYFAFRGEYDRYLSNMRLGGRATRTTASRVSGPVLNSSCRGDQFRVPVTGSLSTDSREASFASQIWNRGQIGRASCREGGADCG